MEYDYACIAALEDGKTRCRRMAQPGSQFCWQPQHKKGGRIAPPPDVILIEPKINPFWFEQLTYEIFLRLVKASEERVNEERQKHIVQAEEVHRRPYALRKTKEASGSPVFGKDGTQFVSVSGLLQEFLEKEYVLTEIHAEPASNPPMMTLTMNFSRQIEFVDQSLFVLMESDPAKAILGIILGSVWRYCHVWANPPDERDRIIHTVSLAHRHDPSTPSKTLKFANGLWRVE